MICGPALSSLPHPPHTRAISHSPLPAYQPATTSHHGLNTSKLSTTSSTLSSTFILDYQHHPRQQVVTPHRASVITLETAGPTFQIFTHLAHGITHSPSSLAAEIKASTRATYRHRRMFRRLTLSLCGLMQDSHAEASSILQGDKALTKRAGRQRIPIYLLSSSNNTTTTSSHHYYYELMVMAFE